MGSSGNLTSIAKKIAEMQLQLDAGKEQIAKTLGAEIVRLYGDSLLGLTQSDLKAMVKYLNVDDAIRHLDAEKKAKAKLQQTAQADSDHDAV